MFHQTSQFSDLNLDGLDYYRARKAIWLSNQARNAEKTGKEIDDRLWELPSLMSAGAYNFVNNSFHVDPGRRYASDGGTEHKPHGTAVR